MLLSEFNLLTGKDHIDPASERDGYLVEYPLVGEDDTPNHPDYAGYISWSPKAAFEAAYTEDSETPKEMNDATRVRRSEVEAILDTAQSKTVDLMGKPHTVTVASMPNGFTVVETSTCVDPENYCPTTGHNVNLGRLRDKVWMLLGYGLQTKLADQQDVTKSEVLRHLRSLLLPVRGKGVLTDSEIDNAIAGIDLVVDPGMTYQDRVRVECDELGYRMVSLYRFMTGDAFSSVPAPEQHRLRSQYAGMKSYYEALKLRISNFGK
jgi:hypothetical protein